MITYDTLTPLGRLPSIASFLLRQSRQRKGPCQGFELVEKIEPAWTEMPSLGARSTWHTAQTKSPDVEGPEFSSFPSLQDVKNTYIYRMTKKILQYVNHRINLEQN